MEKEAIMKCSPRNEKERRIKVDYKVDHSILQPSSSSSSFILHFVCCRSFLVAHSHTHKKVPRIGVCACECVFFKCGAQKNRTEQSRAYNVYTMYVFIAHTIALMKNMSFKLHAHSRFDICTTNTRTE